MTSDVRRESIDAIRRSGQVLEQAREERERIRETLERSKEIDRRRTARGIVRRLVSHI